MISCTKNRKIFPKDSCTFFPCVISSWWMSLSWNTFLLQTSHLPVNQGVQRTHASTLDIVRKIGDTVTLLVTALRVITQEYTVRKVKFEMVFASARSYSLCLYLFLLFYLSFFSPSLCLLHYLPLRLVLYLSSLSLSIFFLSIYLFLFPPSLFPSLSSSWSFILYMSASRKNLKLSFSL